MSDGAAESLGARRSAAEPRPKVDRTDALHERLFGDALGALELYTIYLGERLGLYRALAKSGPATSSQLASRTGTAERYVREWLEQHAASELLAVDDPRAEPLARRYWLPPEHIAVLADPDDLISAARGNAEQAGVANRVRFSVIDAADLRGPGRYDLITIIEALHDMSRPVEALNAARQMIADNGTVLVVDGLVAEEFTVPASPRERTEYGWSVVSCLPGAMADPQTAATGAVMRPPVLHHYVLQAGFAEAEIIPIHTDYWRFYRLLR
jgi:hypothetical protein